MRQPSVRLLVAFVLAATFALPAVAQTTVDLAADQDNTIYEFGDDVSNGAGEHFFAGTISFFPEVRRALIRFDVAGAVPPGATITDVVLTLHLDRNKGNAATIALHRLTSSWGEGVSVATGGGGGGGGGGAAAADDATWKYRFHAYSQWATQGGDYVGAASASRLVSTTDQDYTWSSAGMVADVQAWLDDAASNHGWILLGNESGSETSQRFQSRENPNHPPSLRITYTGPLPVELAAFDAVADGDAAVLSWTTASEDGNAGFGVEHRAPDGAWRETGWVDGAGTTQEEQRYRFRVAGLAPGTHAFRLRQVDLDGGYAYGPVVEVDVRAEMPGGYALSGVYPNPFNPRAQFTIVVDQQQAVRIALHDALGREVALLHDGQLEADRAHVVRIDGGHLASGVYLVRLDGETFHVAEPVTLLR